MIWIIMNDRLCYCVEDWWNSTKFENDNAVKVYDNDAADPISCFKRFILFVRINS